MCFLCLVPCVNHHLISSFLKCQQGWFSSSIITSPSSTSSSSQPPFSSPTPSHPSLLPLVSCDCSPPTRKAESCRSHGGRQ